MEVSGLHTAFPEPHGNTGQDILTTLAPSASTDGVKAGKAGRTGRSRRFRKQPGGGEPSAVSVWHAWRREHEGQLETVFQEHPAAYELFRQAVKWAPETLGEWQQSRVSWRRWVEWRDQHPGPIHEVLADPEGWAVFCQMRAQKNPVNVTYEEWLLLPEQQQQIRSAQWEAWRREHPGPQVLALMLAAETPGGVDEGWQIYRSLQELKGESLPESFEEWRALPKTRREAALSSWALWRGNHEGRLQDVLADSEGWKVYREMLSFLPVGARSRSNRSRAGRRQLPATYEEWLQKPDQQPTLATLTWTAWREQHPGKLPAVLADPEGWTLYREMKMLAGAGRTAETADDSGNIVKPKTTRRGGDKGKRNRRKGTPSTFATAAATPMTTASTTTASAALAGDDGNDDVEVKGGISTADEEQQQVGSTTAEENVDASFFPETYQDWLLRRREKNRRGAVPGGEAGDDDRVAAHKDNTKRWQRWRGEHPGLLEDVLAADAEGWHLYSTWMSRNGERPFFSDINSWLEVQVATRAWMQWREQHPGVLAVALRNSPEGWPLYRNYVAGQLANPTVHRNEQQRQLPETLQEWLQQPAQIVQVTADAWNAWRRAHPGPLRAQLSEQTSGGPEEPCGWQLLRVLLQFYMPSADGAVESADGRPANPAQPLELSDSLEAFLLALKRSSLTAWLRWTQQQQQRHSNLQTRLRDPVGWALYKVMCESDEAAPEFAVNYEEWLQKRHELATVAPGGNPNSVGWSGAGDSSVSHAAGRMAGNASKRQGGPERVAVTAWSRWRRQHRGDLLHVLEKHARGWQLYCNMLAAKNKPVPESFSAFKEAREQQQRQEQAEAVTEWESWRQQHGGPLEDVLTDPRGAALYRRMIEANSNSSTGNDERRNASERAHEASTRWLLWREQHPGPLEVVLAEHPEAVELHCAWLAAESMPPAAPASRGRKRKPRAKGGRGKTTNEEAVRRWREWRAQHPGALQEVLAADLAAAGERRQNAGEMSADGQLLQDAGDASTGWQLFCAHAASQGRQMPASFEEWLQHPQQIARREFGLWRAEHPGLLVDVLRDQEGWQLYVRMRRAAAAAAAEEGSESPEVVEDYDEWVARGKHQRERQNRRRNGRTKADGAQIGTEAGLAEQAYQCGNFAGEGGGIAPSAAGCHGLESNVFGAMPGGGTSAEAHVDGVVR